MFCVQWPLAIGLADRSPKRRRLLAARYRAVLGRGRGLADEPLDEREEDVADLAPAAVDDEGVGPEPPRGMLAHLAYRTETGLRYVEVWQAKDDSEGREHDRVHPPSTP